MDSQGKNKIDQLFGDGLREARVAVPESLWGGIAGQMEQDRLRKRVFWARIGTAASVLLLLGIGTFWATSSGIFGDQPVSLTNMNVISLPYADGTSTQNPADFRFEDANSIASANRVAADDQSTGTVPIRVVAPLDGAVAETPAEIKEAVGKAWLAKIAPVTKLGMPIRFASKANPGQVPAGRDLLRTREQVNLLREAFLNSLPLSENAAEKQEGVLKVNERMQDRFAVAPGDELPKSNEADSRWAFGGAFGPDVSFASQTPVEPSLVGRAASKAALPDDPATAPKKLSDPVMTYAAGARVNYNINKRFGLQSGLTYASRSTNVEAAVQELGEAEKYSTNHQVSYLEVPLSLRYNVISGKRMSYYVASGLSANLFLNYNTELETEQGTIAARRTSDEGEVFLPSQANLLISTGVQYRLFDKLSLNLEPAFRYGFATNNYAFSQSDPMSFGLTSGVSYHF